MVIGYMRLLVFIGLLLAALQLPAIFEQYQQRLTARLTETQQSLSSFQEVANKFFQGDLAQLIEEYRTSDEAELRAQSTSVSDAHRQLLKLKTQIDAINAPWPQILQAHQHINRSVLQEVVQQLEYKSLSVSLLMVAKVTAGVFLSLWVLESLLRLIIAILSYVFYVPKRIKSPRLSNR
jgi:hypothetical protein